MMPEKFEVFDASQNKVLASRSQIPVILAFAMTVHRAQGQTIQNLEIDSASFFAPGQLGVAVGRAVCKQGLCIRNLNMTSAFLKHPKSVYEFYEKPFKAVEADISCCSKVLDKCIEDRPSGPPIETDICLSDTEEDAEEGVGIELPRATCPFNIQEFIAANKSTEFITLLSPEFISSEPFIHHLEYIQFKVSACIEKDSSTRPMWMVSYQNLNEFLVGQEHLNSIRNVFKVKKMTKLQNKMSSKLAFWVMDKIIQVKVQEVVSQPVDQPEPTTSNAHSFSEAGNAKLRYIAGVCVHKIRNRLRDSVERNLGKINKNSKLTRQMNYKKEKMLKALTTSEDGVDPRDSSMSEIEFKQNKSRGLTVVSDELFIFFKNLHSALQTQLTSENLHKHIDRIHTICRNHIDYKSNLLGSWIGLFSSVQDDSIEDEILLVLLAELYQAISEHFIKLSIVDSLKHFKRSIPRKKKQALRTKIQALGERAAGGKKSDNIESRDKDCKTRKRKVTGKGKSKKVKKTDAVEDLFICPSCDNVCEEEPIDPEGESIGCDKCNEWYHYGCVQLTGDESFLQRSNSTWFCSSCSKKGKGRGKSTKK
ncbi:uncharacterized protein LOC127861420 isoform X2 [Dreissena polymorpha]|nr:uncharacterized protein LOC127861420 isoform X2 [Dreissena polymorpha]